MVLAELWVWAVPRREVIERGTAAGVYLCWLRVKQRAGKVFPPGAFDPEESGRPVSQVALGVALGAPRACCFAGFSKARLHALVCLRVAAIAGRLLIFRRRSAPVGLVYHAPVLLAEWASKSSVHWAAWPAAGAGPPACCPAG